MKKFGLGFLDKETEKIYQVKSHLERLCVLKIYIIMKWSIAFIDVLIHVGYNSPIEHYKQGLLSLMMFSIYILMLLKKNIQVTTMVNIMQVSLPIMNLTANCFWPYIKNIPTDTIFMFAVFKTINSLTLYVLGTTYKSNSICFIFAQVIYSYLEFPHLFSINVTNYLGSLLWVIGLKYVNDKDRRNQFLLKIKDEQWTHIMRGLIFLQYADMIDDWVIMVTHNSEMDQIRFRDANLNFKKSCKVTDDKNFRTFLRSIKVQTLGCDRDFTAEQINHQLERRFRESCHTKPADYLVSTNKHPDLEQILVENLNLFSIQCSLIDDSNKAVQMDVKQYFGVKIDMKRKRQTFFSIRMIKGTDTEPFILLFIKKQKNRIDCLSNQEIMKNNLTKMSNICKQYFKGTQILYKEIQNLPRVELYQKKLMMPIITSQLLSVSNSHFVNQLYLNQMHDIKGFTFESQVQTINLKELIIKLQQLKRSQIQIIFNEEAHFNLTIKSFLGELTHLFLILIENTIRHSKLSYPSISIQYYQVDDQVKFIFQDSGQGVSADILKYLLQSYQINNCREKKLKILDQNLFDTHLRQKMRQGWIAARIILSFISPNNIFDVSSTFQSNKGCSVSFSIYNDIAKVIKIRDRNLYIGSRLRNII